MLPNLSHLRNGKAPQGQPAPAPVVSPAALPSVDVADHPLDCDVLFLFNGIDWEKRRGTVTKDRFKVKGSGEFFLLSDLRRVDDRVWFLAVANPSTLRDWESFSGSIRSVVFSSLFEPGSDASQLFRNAIYGALIIAVVVLVIQINSMSGRFADIGSQLSTIQAQLAAPVEIQLSR